MLRDLAASPARRLTLAASAVGWVLVARASQRLSGLTLPETERRLDQLARVLPKLSALPISHAARAVTAAARRVPGTRCLAWSLALRGLLAQAGIAAELRIGVAASQPGKFEAHAWVEAAGASWSFAVDVEDYSVLRPPACARATTG
jgi:hypothetical protein